MVLALLIFAIERFFRIFILLFLAALANFILSVPDTLTHLPCLKIFPGGHLGRSLFFPPFRDRTNTPPPGILFPGKAPGRYQEPWELFRALLSDSSLATRSRFLSMAYIP
ncbi:hypothetical protein phiLo_47 [Thermus phage phiLo]|nr:hypothetical protein phiLo_47 [Thermus phage phiLo]